MGKWINKSKLAFACLANLNNGKILDDNDTVSPPLPPNNDVIFFSSYEEPALKRGVSSPFSWSPFPPWLEPGTHFLSTLTPVFVISRNPPGPRPVKSVLNKIRSEGN